MQHVPKTNGDIPSFDEAFSDHRWLLDKLVLYDLVIQFLNPKVLLFISFMVSLHTRCLLLLTMWRCRWGLLTCLCPVFCRCSASVHRRKHMGGQWDSPDQEYGSISLLYHLAMMMMMQVVTFLDWIYGCIALMQQLTLIRIHSSEIHWLLFLNYPSQSEQVYNISLCTRLVLYPRSHAL